MMGLKSPKLYLILIICLLTCNSCESENILIFVLVCSYSQLNVLHPYGQKLTEAGHNVTMLMPTEYKTPHPKINYWVPKELRQEYDKLLLRKSQAMIKFRIATKGSSQNVRWEALPSVGIHLCKILLKSQNFFGKLENSKFDLVIIDDLFNHCGLGFAYKFNAPFIYFATSPLLPSNYDTFGVDPANSWLPDMRKRWIGNEMNFYQRVQNVWSTLEMHFGYNHFSGYFDGLGELLRSKLNIPDMPELAEIEKNASLIFLNSHFSMEIPRALPPMFVEVGGLQCSKNLKLNIPENINNFIKRFPGFVYISFGTAVDLPNHLEEMFLQTISKFPKAGFIMKWTGKLPDKIPPNLMALSYAPQQEILAHKNILCFISHGGMLSIQEAVYHGVPVIGLPVFADQDFNINNLVRRGAALYLELATLSSSDLESALAELINNSSYRQAMERISKLSKDRPRHPMDTALWWTEYVLRNTKDGTGLNHLKPFGINQYWFQRRCLDVWLFILLVVLFTTYTALRIVGCTLFLIRGVFKFGKIKSE